MSAKDELNDARVKIKKIAASMLVRKESLERELKALRSAGADDERIAIKEEEVAVAEKDYRDALEEIESLKNLAQDADRADLRAVINSVGPRDIDERSAEDIALSNVREHIENLEARADLEDELNPRPKVERAAPAPKPSAKDQLDALKAKKGKPVETVEDGDDEERPPSGIVGPKRTL